ncbi:TatD family hydrolase [Patescibacteria group bacterium]|nr:TatD family hydrolase [Patescibacteria group bacterium]
MLIDTHSHLNFNAFKRDLDEVIKRTLDENIWMINVGSKYETSKRAVEIAEEYKEGVYAAIGLHPIYASNLVKIKTDPEEGDFLAKSEEFDKEKYKELALSKKVVAIGEIGLDYYYRPKTKKKLELFKEKQKEVFLKQLELAKELNLPVILHCRMAHEDLLEVLNFQFSIFNFQLKGVVHCFTGSWEQAKRYLDMGFYLGINGIIYKLDLKEVIEKTPLNRILIETDCPYLTPIGVEMERNEPIFVKYIAEEIAKIKNINFEEVAEATTQNAKALFNI